MPNTAALHEYRDITGHALLLLLIRSSIWSESRVMCNEQPVGQSETTARFETRIVYNLFSEARQTAVRDSM
jgi:hypothetical protein